MDGRTGDMLQKITHYIQRQNNGGWREKQTPVNLRAYHHGVQAKRVDLAILGCKGKQAGVPGAAGWKVSG